MNSLVNYDIQQAQQASETTLEPAAEGKWVDLFKSIESTADSIGTLGRRYQRKNATGGKTEEDLQRVSEYEQELYQLKSSYDQNPPTQAQATQDMKDLNARFSDVKATTRYSIATHVGMDLQSGYMLGEARKEYQVEAENIQKERDQYILLAEQRSGPDIMGMSTDEKVKRGKSIAQQDQFLAVNLNAANNSELPASIRSASLEAGVNIMAQNIVVATNNEIQKTGQFPTSEHLDALAQETTQQLIASGYNPTTAGLITQRAFKDYRRIANDQSKSEQDKIKAASNQYEYLVTQEKRAFYDQTGITPELIQTFGTIYPSLDKETRMNFDATVNNYFANRDKPADQRLSPLGVTPQEAFAISQAISGNADAVTPQGTAVVATTLTDTVSNAIQQQTPQEKVENVETALENLKVVADKLPELLQQYKDMSETDKAAVQRSIENHVKTYLQQTMLALDENRVGYVLKNDRLTPKDKQSDFFDNSLLVSFNSSISKLQNALPDIPREVWSNWMLEAGQKYGELSQMAAATQKDIQRINEFSKEHPESGLSEQELPTYNYPQLKDLVKEKDYQALKELKPTITQSLFNTYTAAGRANVVEDKTVEETLLQKGIFTEDEVKSLRVVARMQGKYFPRKPEFNNPLNIKDTGQNWEGEQGSRNGFVVFKTPEDGIRAASKLFDTYANKHNIDTVKEFISRYAPPSENDTEAYIKTVSSALGVSPDTEIDFTNPSIKARAIKAMIDVESPSRKNDYTYDDIYQIITAGSVNELTEETRQLFRL